MVKRRFKAQESTVKSQLRNTMNKIDASSLKISTDEMNGEVEIIFDRGGKRYVRRCKTWGNPLDNLRAVQLSIEYLYRAVEAYGVEGEDFNRVFDSVFIGIEATPNDSVLLIGNQTEWWQILGVKKTSSKHDIINAFKSLSKVHHPDTGGDKETFIKLRKAYDEAINEQR